MGSYMGKMMSQASNSLKKIVIQFGRIASGTNSLVNVQNTVDGEIRGLKMIAPYGISSCPTTGLFAQMIVNGDTNNVCVGVHNPKAPAAAPGEIVLYSSGSAHIKLSGGSVIINGVDIIQKINSMQSEIDSMKTMITSLENK